MVDELADLGVDKPVIPGVFPLLAPGSVRRFAAVNGTTVPEALFERIEALPTRTPGSRSRSRRRSSCASNCSTPARPGIHLYTLNEAEAPSRIVEGLPLR